MATPKHEALIDLEIMLAEHISKLWNRRWSPVSKKLKRALKNKDFERAHDLADTIDLAPVARKSLKLARTVGNASLLLGASRLTGTVKNRLEGGDREQALENMLVQFETMLSVNATEKVRAKAHQNIETLKAKALDDNEVLVKSALPKNPVQPVVTGAASRNVWAQGGISAIGPVGSLGDEFAHLASNLHTSRLNSFGFIATALETGITHYQVNEVLDSRTCPVCRNMHGKVFSVQQGATQAMTIMQNDDPDSLRQLAPFPSQSKANVARLGQMSADEMAQNGLSLPPYHPNCRGIVSTTKETATTRAQTPSRPASVNEWTDAVSANKLSQKELLSKLNDVDVDRNYHADFLLARMNRMQGYDGPPRRLTAAQYKELEGLETWRGVTATEHITDYKSGTFFAGQGIYGNGTYTVYGPSFGATAQETALMYARQMRDGVFAMKLAPKARTISLDDLRAKQKDLWGDYAAQAGRKERKVLSDYADGLIDKATANQRQARIQAEFSFFQDIYMDEGRFATMLGYDAILIERDKYMIVLNRTMTAVIE